MLTSIYGNVSEENDGSQIEVVSAEVKAHLQPTGIACLGTIFIYENSTRI